MNDNKEDPFRYKREGHLQLKITKLSEFAREQCDARRYSEPVHVLGYLWKIYADVEDDENPVESKPAQKCLGLYLKCYDDDAEEDQYSTAKPTTNGSSTLSCTASATMKLLAQKQGKRALVRELGSDEYRVNGLGWGFQLISFEKLMGPNSAWYDEASDCILLNVDFTADAPNGVSYISRKDVLQVNGEEVSLNKYYLAGNSDYFERFFYGEEYRENNKLELELPATVELFKRLLDTMQPQNRPLDDDCLEGVYHLANQFFLGEVEQKCRIFLSQKSTHSTIFKYRLADTYKFVDLKKQILAESKKGEFSKEEDILENLEEYAKLDEGARKELGSRIGQLFGKAKASAEEPPAKRARTST